MFISVSGPLSRAIIPAVGGNETYPAIRAQLPDEPGKLEYGFLEVYLLDEHGDVRFDANNRPIRDYIHGMTSWRMRPGYENLLPVVLERCLGHG
jgi:hypothetical protein